MDNETVASVEHSVPSHLREFNKVFRLYERWLALHWRQRLIQFGVDKDKRDPKVVEFDAYLSSVLEGHPIEPESLVTVEGVDHAQQVVNLGQESKDEALLPSLIKFPARAYQLEIDPTLPFPLQVSPADYRSMQNSDEVLSRVKEFTDVRLAEDVAKDAALEPGVVLVDLNTALMLSRLHLLQSDDDNGHVLRYYQINDVKPESNGKIDSLYVATLIYKNTLGKEKKVRVHIFLVDVPSDGRKTNDSIVRNFLQPNQKHIVLTSELAKKMDLAKGFIFEEATMYSVP